MLKEGHLQQLLNAVLAMLPSVEFFGQLNKSKSCSSGKSVPLYSGGISFVLLIFIVL
jgi:hypothetical protein